FGNAITTVREPAGAWSGDIEGLPRPLPVRPVRGQMLSLDMDDLGSRPLSTVVETRRAYLIPRRGGPLVVGSTMEEVGFTAETTKNAIDELLDAATSALPVLQGRPPTETWAGLRPGTPDDHPVLGEDPEMDGLYYATGHFRNGILLAPVTAAALAALIVGEGTPPVDLVPFRPDRFSSSVPVGS
ncbi:MAG: FAD-dependent oxidoreductase, partial [Longimicrobiales bacterium]